MLERAGIVEVIARVQQPATGPRIAVVVVAIGLEIEAYRQDQTAVLREALSAAQAAVPGAHARAVRGAHPAWEVPGAAVRVAAGEEGGKINDSEH